MKIRQLAKQFANLTNTVDGLVRARQVARSAITVGDTEVPLEQLGERTQAMADELTVQAGEMTATREYIKTQEKLLDDHHERLIDTTAAAATAFEHAAKAVISVDQAHAAADEALEQASEALTTAAGKNARRRGKTQPEPPEGGWTQGDQWIVENETGQPISVKVWNGTAFVPDLLLADQLLVPGTNGTIQLRDGSVTATNLAVDALDFKQANGMNLNGGVITGGKIQLSHVVNTNTIYQLDTTDTLDEIVGWGMYKSVDSDTEWEFVRIDRPVPTFWMWISANARLSENATLRIVARPSVDIEMWASALNPYGRPILKTIHHQLEAGKWQEMTGTHALTLNGSPLAHLKRISGIELTTHVEGNQNWYLDVAVIEVIDRQVINEGLFIGRDPLDAVLRIDDATQACTVRDTGVSITRKSDKKKLELDSSGIKTDHALAVVSQVKADINAPAIGLKASTAAKIEAPTVEHKATSTVKSEAPAVIVKGSTAAKVEGQNITVAGSETVTIAAPTVTVAGQQIHDTGWHYLKLARGWKTVTGHTPRARVRNGTLFVEGAARREAGGALTHIATLPAQVLSKVTGSKDSFVGAFSALKAGGGHAHGELYLTTSSGVIGTGDYTTLDPYAGWVVPLTFTISADQ